MPRYDLLIAGGTVLDPANSLEAVADVAISDGLVDRVEPEIDRSLAAEVMDADGLWVMPGMVDGHVHVGGERATWDPALGFRMLALAGVTTGIDFGSTPETLFDGMQRLGAGINIGGLLVLRPGSTIPHDDPPPPEVRSIVADAMRRGAIGVKIIGGYDPFTPEVTADIIAACNEQRAYVGYHIGTKETGSRLDGMREVPELVGNGRLHVAHINAYTRGSILDPVDECTEALEILTAKKGAVQLRGAPGRAQRHLRRVRRRRFRTGGCCQELPQPWRLPHHRRRHPGRHSRRLCVGVAGERRRHRLRQVRRGPGDLRGTRHQLSR